MGLISWDCTGQSIVMNYSDPIKELYLDKKDHVREHPRDNA